MAESLMLNVSEDFNLNALTQQLADMYRAKGFTVNVVNFNDSVILEFDKGVGGINMLLGMDQGIKATFTVTGNTLMVNYSDASWTGKIIGLCVGWFVCFVPFVTAIIGSINQSKLPKELNTAITMLSTQPQQPQPPQY